MEKQSHRSLAPIFMTRFLLLLLCRSFGAGARFIAVACVCRCVDCSIVTAHSFFYPTVVSVSALSEAANVDR